MIILFVINVIKIYAFNASIQEYYLYPTVGEFYEYYIQNFVSVTQLMCKMYPQVPNVQVINYCEEIYKTQGNQFISMSSNNTHFGTLSKENEVIIYEWKNQMIQQVGQSVTIDSSFHCFNINLSLNFSIIVDCYQNNEFFLIQLMEAQSNITYSIQSPIPTSTKIQSIINGTNAFIVYAQYFDNYSILTLFSSQFYNLSSLNNQFVDFDIPITISPNIYAITYQEIFQLSISPDSQLYIKYNFSKDDMSNFTTINVYYDLWMYSQCDQIQLLYLQLLNSSSEFKIILLLACENQIIKLSDFCPFKSCNTIQNLLQNNQFLIQQSINEMSILQLQRNNSVSFYQINQSNSLLYFNDDTVKRSYRKQILKGIQKINNIHRYFLLLFQQNIKKQFYLNSPNSKKKIELALFDYKLFLFGFQQYFDSQNYYITKTKYLQNIRLKNTKIFY